MIQMRWTHRSSQAACLGQVGPCVKYRGYPDFVVNYKKEPELIEQRKVKAVVYFYCPGTLYPLVWLAETIVEIGGKRDLTPVFEEAQKKFQELVEQKIVTKVEPDDDRPNN